MTKFFNDKYLNDTGAKNPEVRKAINDSGLRYYEVAELIGCHPTTLSSWLARNMSQAKTDYILKTLKEFKESSANN